MITSDLNLDEFFKVSQCGFAKEMWDILEGTHEGTQNVKRAEKHALIQEYEIFRMMKGETILDVQKRFTHIVNHIISIAKIFEREELNIKIFKCFDRTWQPKVTAISESKNLTTLTTTSLFGKLREHKLEMNRLNDQENKEKHVKGIALKAAGQKGDQDSSDYSDSETFNLLTRKFDKFSKKNNREKSQPSNRYNSKNVNEFNSTNYTYFGCGIQEHIKVECPSNVSKEKGGYKKFEKKGKSRRAYIAWQNNDDSSSSSSSKGR